MIVFFSFNISCRWHDGQQPDPSWPWLLFMERFCRLEPDPFTTGCWILHLLMFSFVELLLAQASSAQQNHCPEIQAKPIFLESPLQLIFLLERPYRALFPCTSGSQTQAAVSHPSPCCIWDSVSGFISQCTWCMSACFINLLSFPGTVKKFHPFLEYLHWEAYPTTLNKYLHFRYQAT